MTDEQLVAISERVSRTTPGPWFPIRTDDEHFQSATYVGRQPRGNEMENGFYADQGRRKKRLFVGGVDAEQVVAITLLQYPSLAYQDECDENALFIAHARQDVPDLLAEIHRLRALLNSHE